MALRDWPIKRKLTATLLLTSGLVLLLTSAAFVTVEVLAFRQTTLSNLSTLGRVLAANITPALAFANQADARGVLAALSANPHVVAAGLYDRDGRLFSRFPADLPIAALPLAPPVDGYLFQQGCVIRLDPVHEVVHPLPGTLHFQSPLSHLSRTLPPRAPL